jgi:hypothetical protein
MRYILTLAALAATTAAPAADLDFGLLDRRVAALEERIAALEAGAPKSAAHAHHAPAPAADTYAAAYAAAYARAVAEGKPLVCWVGGGDAVCPACVKTLAGEVVSHVAPTLPGVAGQALVVGMPDGRGQLDQAAVVTQWITGDATWGHVPSLRRAIARWRATRTGVSSGWSLDMAATAPVVVAATPVVVPAQAMFAAPAPMMRMMAPRAAPMRRAFRGGGCSSCG